MPKVLNVKIHSEGIVLDIIDYDKDGEFDELEGLEPLGWMMWNDPPKEIVAWLKRNLVKNSDMYDRIDIDVEGVD